MGKMQIQRKNITATARFLTEAWNIGVFGTVWIMFYNKYAFRSNWLFGEILTLLLFFIIYNSLCNLYKAFRIASSSIGETVFSQMIAFGLADVILYAECCLIYNRYINILPGMVSAIVQIIGTSVIITAAKRYFMNHILPRKTILLFGEKVQILEAEAFRDRILKKYAHLFSIIYMDCESKDITKHMKECETVILYEVSTDTRSKMLKTCLREQKNIYLTPNVEDIILQGCSVKHLLDTPLLKYDYIYQRVHYCFTKRTFDIVLSLVMIVLTFPLMLLTAAAIKLEDSGPVFYFQKRCSRNGKVFQIIKFRSMIPDAEKKGVIPCKENDDRVTKVGKFIRAVRIDELPQLFNILRGDMSFVGPRPERVEHVEQYMQEVPGFGYRMKVKGGLTGYAQIFGKYNTSAYDKLRLDMMYIENQSLILDLKIIMLTIRTIFQPESTEGFSEEESKEINGKIKEKQIISMKTGSVGSRLIAERDGMIKQG